MAALSSMRAGATAVAVRLFCCVMASAVTVTSGAIYDVISVNATGSILIIEAMDVPQRHAIPSG